MWGLQRVVVSRHRRAEVRSGRPALTLARFGRFASPHPSIKSQIEV